jgi:Leucine-rich repeat (LRR) protein
VSKEEGQEEQQQTRGYFFQSLNNNSPVDLLEEDEETEQDITIGTSATTGEQTYSRGRDPDKTFGSSYFWEGTDPIFGEEGFNSRGIGFSMPNFPTQPKPIPTAAPSTQPPVPSPTLPPTSSPPVPMPTSASATLPPVPAPTSIPVTPPPVPAPTPAPDTSPPVPVPTAAPVTSPPSADATIPPAEPPTREDREVLIQAKCGITGLERSRDILVELLKVSKAPDLVNPVTSQFAARDWIDNVDEAIICQDNIPRIHQRYRLALLYFQMGGSQWTRCRAKDSSLSVVYDDLVIGTDEGCPSVPFLDKLNECEWYGMNCGESYDSVQAEWVDQYFPLEVLDLRSNNLAGVLFDELYGLEKLKVLQLSGNEKISGSLSEGIGSLTSLQELDVRDNSISGSLPSAFYGLGELTSLALSNNSLDGKVSNDIGGLSKLKFLQVQSNMLNGTVPEDGLLLLQQLETLSIQKNQIEGSLDALCEILEERREELGSYLSILQADCDEISCSCCECS